LAGRRSEIRRRALLSLLRYVDVLQLIMTITTIVMYVVFSFCFFTTQVHKSAAVNNDK
jgi:hypothetical protein